MDGRPKLTFTGIVARISPPKEGRTNSTATVEYLGGTSFVSIPPAQLGKIEEGHQYTFQTSTYVKDGGFRAGDLLGVKAA